MANAGNDQLTIGSSGNYTEQIFTTYCHITILQ